MKHLALVDDTSKGPELYDWDEDDLDAHETMTGFEFVHLLATTEARDHVKVTILQIIDQTEGVAGIVVDLTDLAARLEREESTVRELLNLWVVPLGWVECVGAIGDKGRPIKRYITLRSVNV